MPHTRNPSSPTLPSPPPSSMWLCMFAYLIAADCDITLDIYGGNCCRGSNSSSNSSKQRQPSATLSPSFALSPSLFTSLALFHLPGRHFDKPRCSACSPRQESSSSSSSNIRRRRSINTAATISFACLLYPPPSACPSLLRLRLPRCLLRCC